jgi:hypothetical protein
MNVDRTMRVGQTTTTATKKIPGTVMDIIETMTTSIGGEEAR